MPPKWRGTVHSSGVHAFTVLCLKLVYSWSLCNILTRLLCDNNLVKTDIERLMNVSTYFSDNGNNSSWTDHYSKSVRPSVRLSVCLSVCPLRFFGIRWKRLNIPSQFFFHRTNRSSFTRVKHLHEIPTESPPTGALNTGGVYKFLDFQPISRYISQTIQDSAIVTIESE